MSYTIELRQQHTNLVLDSKTGESVADILREYADEGCIAGGDTLAVIDNDEQD